MSPPLVECIPNFSEGRRGDVIDSLLDSLRSVPGVALLDHHSDKDHNRTVATIAGPPEAVAQAAFNAIAKAADLIDMHEHQGEHPRIGATDVVPLVPLEDVSMQDCVELARSLGERVAQELEIPVYLYEAAATRPDRTNLEAIRRGEFETLKEAIGSDPDRRPDFGPAKLGSAGATVIGARPALIAFNVYLTTGEVDVAKRIARAVRHSSGGLRFVKALGLLVEGRAQVSMNLTDFQRTPIARVVEMIRREARRYGVLVHGSELVGLAPQAALIDAARYYLQLEGFDPDQLLERRLSARLEGRERQHSFLERLARGTPTPGGGSASAYAGAMAAGLVAMVARLTLGREKYAAVEARMQDIAQRADVLRGALERAVQQDAQAFDRVMDAYRMPKDSEAARAARVEAIEQATQGAAEVPLRVARMAVEVVQLAAEVAAKGNVNAASDARVAGAMAQAAMTGASMNVRINSALVQDQQTAEGWRATLGELVSQFEAAHKLVLDAIQARLELGG
jgi:glutamate formiminotransferase/formiminotetrahydrofolate cyclodeaminase